MSTGQRVRRAVLVIMVVIALVGATAATARWWTGLEPVDERVSPVGAIPLPHLARTALTSNGEAVAIPVSGANRVTPTVPPKHGRLAISGVTIGYRPAADHIGPDRIRVRACNTSGCADLTASVTTVRPGLSSLSSVVNRGLVRRADQPLRPGTTVSTTLPDGLAAAALSVTIYGARRAGTVVVDAGRGRIEAVRAPRRGATVTNVIFVPVTGRELRITDRAGGGLTVDVVGQFAAARQARAGRFVAVDRTRVAELNTATDGRRATIHASDYGARAGIRAALVLVTAEIGPRTAWVDFGRRRGDIDRTMTWGPGGVGLERRSVGLVPVSSRGDFSFDYQHGSRITVDVLGYFTGDRAAERVSGLFVPRSPSRIFDGRASSAGRKVDAPAPAGALVVTLRGEPGVAGDRSVRDVGIASGRTITTVLPAVRGRTTIRTRDPLRVRVDLLGYFVR